MDVRTALEQTDGVVTRLIAGLTPDDRDAATPCEEWTVHELINHVCGGAHMVAGALEGASLDVGPDDEMPDFLTDGPAAGWRAAAEHLAAASTPEALAASYAMPFGEVTGEQAVAVITADHITHAWDLAQATGQPADLGEDLARFALDTWSPVLPPAPRTGPGFKDPVAVPDAAPVVDRLVAATGRQP